MENFDASQDDLLDVIEMTEKIESYICQILVDNEVTLGMSALMSACINCTLAQCKTFDEVILYRNIFMQIFDSSIRNINIKN